MLNKHFFLDGRALEKAVDLTKLIRVLEENLTTSRCKGSEESRVAGSKAAKETAGLEAGLGARTYHI